MKFEVSVCMLNVSLDNGITLNFSSGMFTKSLCLEHCINISTYSKFDNFVNRFIKMDMNELKGCKLNYCWHNDNGESEFHVEQGKFSYSGGDSNSGEFTFSIEITDDNREQLNKLLLDVSKIWDNSSLEECCGED